MSNAAMRSPNRLVDPFHRHRRFAQQLVGALGRRFEQAGVFFELVFQGLVGGIDGGDDFFLIAKRHRDHRGDGDQVRAFYQSRC